MSEEQRLEDTGTPPAAVATSKKDGEKPFEIDYDRLAGGDEEYQKEVNRQLQENPQLVGAEPQSAEEGQGESKVPEKKPDEPEYFNFEDGPPIYKGEEFKVRKDELKMYVQKGRHMDETLEQIAPLRKVAREIPALGEILTAAANDPEVAREVRKVVETLRSGGKLVLPEEEDDLSDLQVDGLDELDVQNVAKVNKALRERERQREEQRRERELESEQASIQQQDIAARAYVSALRTHEGETFDKVRPYMKELMAEAERTTDPATFAQFKAAILNPFAVDADGTPAFHHFYMEAKDRYMEKEGRVARRSIELKPPPMNQTRLQPGSADDTRGASRSGQPDWENMPQSEFDRRMNEALSKA